MNSISKLLATPEWWFTVVVVGFVLTVLAAFVKDSCAAASLPDRCLRTPEKTETLQVAFFIGRLAGKYQHTERMKQRIDSAEVRALYGRRFATVEPVFANLRHNKRLDRFTLRGQAKVDGQWTLFALVHNIEKLAHHGYAQ